jgi:hypothetical protein
MRARDYSPRSKFHADAKILDGLSATVTLPDYGRVARHWLRTATIPASGFQRRFTEAIA